MITVGLTGSIGMGKSTTAAMFAAEGVPVYDADAEVHALYAKGGAAVGPVGEAFPGVVVDDAIDRPLLSRQVVGKPEEMKRLEAIVHPLVGMSRVGFFERAAAAKADIVILDIPCCSRPAEKNEWMLSLLFQPRPISSAGGFWLAPTWTKPSLTPS